MINYTISRIQAADEAAMQAAWNRWDSIAKPLRSLGRLEEAVVRIAGMKRTDRVELGRKALVVMCADNGVVEEGVSQTGSEVTAIVAENFLDGKCSAAIMANQLGVTMYPLDVGMRVSTRVPRCKTAAGTGNIRRGPAMRRQQAEETMEAALRLVMDLKCRGYGIITTGEMGIGNTTTSAAVASVLLGLAPEDVTGRGAGLDSAGLARKIQVIKDAIAVNQPNPEDPMDVLAKVGGFDIVGLTGVFLGAAAEGIPAVIDGFISGTAALAAVRMEPKVRDYLIASHVSKEPGHALILDALGLKPFLTCDMCLGEGTGALAALPLLDLALGVYDGMSTFEEIQVEPYRPLE